jgi:RES domain-containing protein
MPALYLSLDVITAIKEANQGFAHKMEPYILCSYDVDCEDIVDLGDDAGRSVAGVEDSLLSAGWYAHIAAGSEPPQWKLVSGLVSRGAADAVVPSYAPGATAADCNLVLWRWGPSLPNKIEVFDPSGRLPKNPLSWD